ncbi:MAG: PleD family two-component system response regulator [Acidobacteriota bacterium]|nr:response regulator [Thermoanaerobaculaceae bacterium]
MHNKKRVVLIIDDNPDLLDIVDAILSDSGFIVAKAASGESGIEISKTLKPDLILLDINMPRIDGFEVLTQLKQTEETKNIPVAMFSVRSDLRDKKLSFQKGAIDYISKPFQYNRLTEKVEKILERAIA